MSRIVFMGTPEFAVPSLLKLIETQEVVGVVTQPDRPAGRGQELRPSPVKAAAASHAIPLYQPKSLKAPESTEPIRAWNPDVIVVAAFGQILRPHLLNLPPHGCLNVHASLLPRWRGASPIHHAILAGDTETGITLMQMDAGLDTGPMYVQQVIPIHPDETAASLHDRLALLGADMVGEFLAEILAGWLQPRPQDATLMTYAPMIAKEAGQITWGKTAVEIDRHIRAMTPWPGAFTFWDGQLVKILRARPQTDPSLPTGEPGQVMPHPDGVMVLTGDGGLILDQLQLAGKKVMEAREFVRGRGDFLTARLS
ncbi:MAG: methionyl-tRNA formyltransferase [Chloroflexi bacterium]|nr:methionyl-tRNA formyltransferase [Chloroflexota bacterium]